MAQLRDGSYYADGRVVHKSPEEVSTANGIGINIGFPVCQLSEWVGGEAAQIIADALNAARSSAPEGDWPEIQPVSSEAAVVHVFDELVRGSPHSSKIRRADLERADRAADEVRRKFIDKLYAENLPFGAIAGKKLKRAEQDAFAAALGLEIAEEGENG